MANPKFIQGGVKVGLRNIPDQAASLEELAKCDPCGCNGCKCYETICSATTGELLIRYYTGVIGGPYTEVIEDYETGIANIEALYVIRYTSSSKIPSSSAAPSSSVLPSSSIPASSSIPTSSSIPASSSV